MNDNIIKIKRALISVFDKTDIVKLAKSLAEHGIETVSYTHLTLPTTPYV